MTFARLVATAFGLGLLRPAPGTWGSLGALPLALCLHLAGGPVLLALATAGIFLVGWWVTHVATRGMEDHDPSEIVIDEVAGQLCALWPVSIGAAMAGAPVLALWPGWIAGFLLFRVFDIWKPGPVGWADRRHDALGVMLDDIFAGVMAALGVAVLAAVAHGVFV
ncbi:MAG: phosphatidylglycerophosphatase A [Pseudomonadota bacterium]